MKNVLDNIIESSENTTIHIYPEYSKTTHTITPNIYTQNEIDKITEKIKKLSLKKINIIQEECFYRDLVKLTITSNKKTSITHYKKSITYNEFDKIIVLKNNIVNIPNNKIPVLSHYDNIEHKNMIIYELNTIDVLIINNQQICINVKNFLKREKLKEELELVFGFLS